jgi:beta-lactamase class A
VLSALLLALLVAAALAPTAAAQSPDASAKAEILRLIRQSGAEVSVVARPLDDRRPAFNFYLDPDKPYHAASTMKVAVMIELFAQARAGKLRLEDPLSIQNEFYSLADGSTFRVDPASDSDPDVYKALGNTMTLRELCVHMITRSSNLATDLLIQKLGVANIRESVHRLHADGMQVLRGVEDDKAFAAGLNNTTTARGLAILLQAIAQGRAVDPASSAQMLEILKHQQFREAIPAGLPPDVPVAHKTGEITKIHHDAAIVYAHRPFILVILVRGIAERVRSSQLMAEITRIVFRAIEPLRGPGGVAPLFLRHPPVYPVSPAKQKPLNASRPLPGANWQRKNTGGSQ